MKGILTKMKHKNSSFFVRRQMPNINLVRKVPNLSVNILVPSLVHLQNFLAFRNLYNTTKQNIFRLVFRRTRVHYLTKHITQPYTLPQFPEATAVGSHLLCSRSRNEGYYSISSNVRNMEMFAGFWPISCLHKLFLPAKV